LTDEQLDILGHMSVEWIDDAKGGLVKTIRFTGVNVQIVNGLGATNGYPADPLSIDPNLTATDGTGNLIIGYNEFGNPNGEDRTGSHNLCVGIQVNASSFGGQSVGFRNCIAGPYASVSGGTQNLASGYGASISGGNAGLASGQNAVITAGQLNVASGLRTAVHGGGSNHAMAEESVVVGGGHAFDQVFGNVTNGTRSVIVGGQGNQTLSGANGQEAVISGGLGRTTTGNYDWVAGSLFEDQ
jgi:hypothetical protein